MKTYYLIEINQFHIYTNSIFESLDEAVKKARMLTKASPNRQIAIVKTIGLVSYITTTTGEHEEIFFNN